MRCLALAGGLRAAGARCVFVSRRHQGNLLRRIEAEGFPVRQLRETAASSGDSGRESPYAAWLGVDGDSDAEETLAALRGRNLDWLVVDHYALDARWEWRVRAATRRVLAIDDLADREHDCELLLDQGPGRLPGDYTRLVGAGVRLLVGPRFALLRPEFARLRPDAERRSRTMTRRLLITLGGVDGGDATSAVLRGLAGLGISEGFSVTVVMGSLAPWLDKVRAAASALPCEAEVRVDAADMAALMQDSDLAIGAAGITALERCSMGLPSIGIVLAANQRSSAQALARSGAMLLADEDAPVEQQVVRLLPQLMEAGQLAAMSRAALAVTDGRGVARVVEELLHGR